MLDLLSEAGIDYTGGGYDLEDAKIPTVKLVGGTGIAIVGADMTVTKDGRSCFRKIRNCYGRL